MRCIFCRADSGSSKSKEHIIPESLGNKSHVLPPGVVCDSCNNYFSHEVERVFLESPPIRALRFHQLVESKKGRVPPLSGVILPDIATVITRHQDSMSADISPNDINKLMGMTEGKLILPMATNLPTGIVASRFLAKVAVEALAARFSGTEGGIDYLCDDPQFDPLRDHARRGTTPHWPVHSRQIYDADARMPGALGAPEQIVHEFDFLVMDSGEWYFILAIFGAEFSINVGGPDIDGYLVWLRRNNGASPLYSGKNADFRKPTQLLER